MPCGSDDYGGRQDQSGEDFVLDFGKVQVDERGIKENRERFYSMSGRRLFTGRFGCGIIAGILAENDISIFAVSTYNTDYILLKEEKYQKALKVLGDSGYKIVE